MTKTFDWLVIGGGFRSIVVAYLLAESGRKVGLIEAGKAIGGFLAPIQWDQYWIDRGPQFFDNFGPADLALMNRMIGPNVLKDIGFSYAAYTGGQLTEGFAIPDWRAKGADFTAAVFQDLLKIHAQARRAGVPDFRTFADLIAFDGGAHLSGENAEMTRKFLRQDAAELSPSAACMTTFTGRKVLFDQEVSVDLKRSPLIDGFLAAQKAVVNEERYNLYPKGETLETVRLAMIAALDRVGVEVMTETTLADLSETGDQVILSSGQVAAGQIYFGCDIRDSERVLRGTDELAGLTHVLPEIFHCFEVPTDAVNPSYYVVDYDPDHLSSRMTNFCHYMGGMQDTGVFCVEQPIDRDSAQWETPELDCDRIFEEAREAGNVAAKHYSKARSFRVPATYKVPLFGYDAAESQLIEEVGARFGGRVHLPRFVLTRKEALDQIAQADLLVA